MKKPTPCTDLSRVNINKKENWVLNKTERTLLRGIRESLTEKFPSGLTLCQIYGKVLKHDNRGWETYRIKYLLMFMWKQHQIKIKYNNGAAFIIWRK